ncbi:hypothetical protein F7Q91_02725 [Vibrio chagasii]|uniref:Uncharacterized protein n=1 Tax=Vibrio chagasii TaxID=170679 RepID=A0A7V7NWT6_9VIBR|nr:hypothetical protein [Vibrio chagasii]KAB0482334.1 hypothetical protein F7Q91_02725 [Vibrio chagasii]
MNTVIQNLKNIQFCHVLGGAKSVSDIDFISLVENEAGHFGNFAMKDAETGMVRLHKLVLATSPNTETYQRLIDSIKSGNTEDIVFYHVEPLTFPSIEDMIDYMGIEGINADEQELKITDLKSLEVAA